MSETKWTPGPWEYVPSTEHHGPYVSGPWGGDICDCYTMTDTSGWSVRNGGTSRPVNHQGDMADANARMIASAPDLYEALEKLMSVPIVADYAGDNEHLDAAISAARAALSRAKGETTSPPPSDRATTDKREGG